MLQNSTNPWTNALYLCFRRVIGGEATLTCVTRGTGNTGLLPQCNPCRSDMVHTLSSPPHVQPASWFCMIVWGGLVWVALFCFILAKLTCLGSWHAPPCGKDKVKSHFLYLRVAVVNFWAHSEVCPWSWTSLRSLWLIWRSSELWATGGELKKWQSHAESTRLTKGENKGK